MPRISFLASLFAPHETETLYAGANFAIWQSHQLAAQCAKSTAREEDYVATLVTDGVLFLAERWVPVLRSKGIGLKLSGVFCHGHPQVSFGAPPSRVELADLLVVHQHTKATRVSARAILLQAKMSRDSTHRLSSPDPQLHLFRTWPPFEFVSGGLVRGLRDLKENGRGSRYALVLDKHAYPEQITWADQCPWAASPAEQRLTADRSLARLLGDMLLNKDGRPFHLGKASDDWSRTILELLQITGQRTYRRANIGRGLAARLTEAPLGTPGVLMMYADGIQPGSSTSPARASLADRYFGTASDSQGNGRDGGDAPAEARDASFGGMSSLIIETAEGAW